MINSILLVLSGIVITALFSWIRSYIVKQAVTTVTSKEKFSGFKFLNGMFNVVDLKEWAKDIASLFNIRKLTVIGLILGVVWGVGFYKGKLSKPVQFNGINYEKEFKVYIPDNMVMFEKPANSTVAFWVDAKGNKKAVTVGEIPELARRLKPYGIIFEPVAVGGFGLSNVSTKAEGGVGFRYLKFYNWVTDVCLTNGGFYPLGISYKLSPNTAIGISTGTGFKEGERGWFSKVLAKITIKF